MTRAILVALAVVGVCGQYSSVQAQYGPPPLGSGPSYQPFPLFNVDEDTENEEITDDDLEAYLNLLSEFARQQQRPAGANRQFSPNQPSAPPQYIRQPVAMPQPQGPSRQELVQLLQLRKMQAAQLERQFPLLQQQAASYRQISQGMGPSGYVLQSQFDNQVRICQMQYAAVMGDIQAIEARLGGLGR